MSQGPLCPNLTQKVQREVSQMSNRNFSRVMLLGGLSVNLNHLKIAALPFIFVNHLKIILHHFVSFSEFVSCLFL